MLINILDRLERVKVDKIPNKIKTDLWVYKKKDILVEGKLTPVEISISKNKDGVWLFSKRQWTPCLFIMTP